MDSSAMRHNDLFCGGRLTANIPTHHTFNSGYEEGVTGFLAGGLLDSYLKQQQQQQLQQQQRPNEPMMELNMGLQYLSNNNNNSNNNDAFGGISCSMDWSTMMTGGGGVGGGTFGDVGDTTGFGTTTITPSYSQGLVSTNLCNRAPQNTADDSLVGPEMIDSLDFDLSLLQRLQKGMSQQQVVFPQEQQPQEKIKNNNNNKWIGDMTGEGDVYAENGILGPWSATSAGLLGNMVAGSSDDNAKKTRKQNKSKDKPKRALSAYNIFFKEERNRILEALPEAGEQQLTQDGKGSSSSGGGGRKRKKKPHGKIGFESLAKVVGQRWQELTADQVNHYKEKAEQDKFRYKQEMEKYVLSGGSNMDHAILTGNSVHKEEEEQQQQQQTQLWDWGEQEGLVDFSNLGNVFQQEYPAKRQRLDFPQLV